MSKEKQEVLKVISGEIFDYETYTDKLCDYCMEKPVAWMYVDGTYACDGCVPRGCSCNREYVDNDYYEDPTFDDYPFIWGDDNGSRYWASVDSKGREYPCCEWVEV